MCQEKLQVAIVQNVDLVAVVCHTIVAFVKSVEAVMTSSPVVWRKGRLLDF